MRDALGGIQSVLVLGGGSDLAQATVRLLVGQRCRTVVLAARHPEELRGFALELDASGDIEVEPTAFDARDTDDHAAFVDGVFDAHGDIDVVLVAFGILGDQADYDTDPAAAADAVTANFAGAVSCGLAVANRFREQGHGTLVVLSSVAGERVRSENYVYGSSKAGLSGFALGLGDALVGSGARVMLVRLGFVPTSMTEGMEPAPFATTTEAVASAIVDGLASGRETVWVPAKLRWVLAVARHLPRSLWRRISVR